MLAILKTTPTGLKRLEEFEPGSWIDLVTPTVEELEQVSRELVIPLDLLKGPLDEEEKSRIDVEDGLTHVIVDIPVLVREEDQQGYETIPLGILIHPDYIITTCLRPNPILGEFEHGVVRGFATFWKTRLLLQILQRVAAFYLRYLGRIDRETDKIERELRASMKNAEIFDLLSLQKSLVYFTTSLRSNEGVLQKLNRTKTVKMYDIQFGVLRIIILLMVLLSVVNSVNMSVFERVGEFGTMMALGNRSRRVIELIIMENVIIGLVGAVAGVALGMVLALVISAIGIPMPPPPNADLTYVAHIRIVPAVVTSAFAVGLIATVMAAFLPALRVRRIPIVDALRQSI